jgi:hypothetical protein
MVGEVVMVGVAGGVMVPVTVMVAVPVVVIVAVRVGVAVERSPCPLKATNRIKPRQ